MAQTSSAPLTAQTGTPMAMGRPMTLQTMWTRQRSQTLRCLKTEFGLTTNNTLKVWYLPVNSIGGAAVALDMTSIFQLGGYIMAGMTWTLDAGYGVDDYLVFITSNGEALVWRLTDPTTPTGISQIGLYKVGAPIGRRCYTKFGGDLLVITQDGVVPMSGSLQSHLGLIQGCPSPTRFSTL
jgi:hypothetical protein